MCTINDYVWVPAVNVICRLQSNTLFTETMCTSIKTIIVVNNGALCKRTPS